MPKTSPGRTLAKPKPTGTETSNKLVCTQNPGEAQKWEVLGIFEGRCERWAENRGHWLKKDVLISPLLGNKTRDLLFSKDDSALSSRTPRQG